MNKKALAVFFAIAFFSFVGSIAGNILVNRKGDPILGAPNPPIYAPDDLKQIWGYLTWDIRIKLLYVASQGHSYEQLMYVYEVQDSLRKYLPNSFYLQKLPGK